MKESRHSDKSVKQPSYRQLKIQLVKLYDRRRRSPEGEHRLSSHTWVYHTPPTESSRNHTVKYDEDDDNGETGEEDMRNVESDEKERESGHFVDMCDTENNDKTDIDGSSKTAEYEKNIRPRHFCGKSYRTVVC